MCEAMIEYKEGKRILSHIAEGVLKWADPERKKKKITLPYKLKRGFELLHYQMLKQNVPINHIPFTLTEIQEILSQELTEWNNIKWGNSNEFDIKDHQHETFLSYGRAGELSYTISREIKFESEIEERQKESYNELLSISQESSGKTKDRQKMYTRLRSFLVSNPVVYPLELEQKDKELFSLLNNPSRDYNFYEPERIDFIHNGKINNCSYCGFPLRKGERHMGVCKLNNAHVEKKEILKRKRNSRFKQKNFYTIMPEILHYVTKPGIPELKLFEQLKNNLPNCVITLYPDFDDVDISIEHTPTEQTKQVIGLDLKDWSSPLQLGREIKEKSSNTKYNYFAFVVPDHRKENNYMDRLLKEVQPSGSTSKNILYASKILNLIKKMTGES